MGCGNGKCCGKLFTALVAASSPEGSQQGSQLSSGPSRRLKLWGNFISEAQPCFLPHEASRAESPQPLQQPPQPGKAVPETEMAVFHLVCSFPIHSLLFLYSSPASFELAIGFKRCCVKGAFPAPAKQKQDVLEFSQVLSPLFSLLLLPTKAKRT